MKRQQAGIARPLLLVVGAVGGAGLLGMLVMQGQRTRELEMQVQQRAQQTQTLETQLQQMTEQLVALKAERDEMDRKLGAARSQLNTATTELERSHDSLAQLQEKYQRLGEQHSKLESELVYVRAEQEASKAEFQAAKDSKEDLERQVMRLQHRVALMNREYQQLAEQQSEESGHHGSGLRIAGESSQPVRQPDADAGVSRPQAAASFAPSASAGGRGFVELPPVVIVREQDAAGTVRLRGKVVQVDAANRFVVIDRGLDDGVRAGMVYTIMHQGTPVAQVRVVRVRRELSACDIITERGQGLLRVGDSAIQTSAELNSR